MKMMKAEVENLKFSSNELASISKLNSNPPSYINRVSSSDERLILTKNGTPVAGLVPLWMLCVVDKYINGELTFK
jgi:prevent-host-death family protein